MDITFMLPLINAPAFLEIFRSINILVWLHQWLYDSSAHFANPDIKSIKVLDIRKIKEFLKNKAMLK